MDSLFREYANPFLLLNQIIRNKRLNDFLDTFQQKQEEKKRWEFYLHKLSPLDDRTWNEFNEDLDKQKPRSTWIPARNELETTINNSYEILRGFEINRIGGEMEVDSA